MGLTKRRRNFTERERKAFGKLVVSSTGWLWLVRGDVFNPQAKTFAVGRSGVYALRDRRSGVVHYVGESHTDRLWKTMLRHTHAQDSFERVAQGEWVFRGDREGLDVRFWSTDPDDTLSVEAALIQELKPTANEVGHESDWIGGSGHGELEEAPF